MIGAVGAVIDVADRTHRLEFLGAVGVVDLEPLLATLRRDQEVGGRTGEHQHGGEHVDAGAEDMGRGVRAHQFDAESANAVARYVQREQAPVADPEPPVHGDEHDHHRDVPQQFVEERRVHHCDDGPVRRARDQAGVGEAVGVDPLVDLQSPRHGGLAAVQFLVEVVAESTDGLGQQDRRGQCVAERRQFDAVVARADPGPQRTEQDRTPNAESAVPDLEGVDRVLGPVPEVGLPVGGDVIEPSADQAERHRPDRDVEDLTILAAAGDPTPVAPPHGDDDPDDDAQRVRPDRHRTEMPDTLRRARDVGQDRRCRMRRSGDRRRPSEECRHRHAATLADPWSAQIRVPSRPGNAPRRPIRRQEMRGRRHLSSPR